MSKCCMQKWTWATTTEGNNWRKHYQILDTLENKQDDHYAKHCLQTSKDMAEKNQMSLMQKVNTLCSNFNLYELYYFLNDNSSTYINNIQLTIREELTSHQYNLIKNNKKLKFHSIFINECHKSDCQWI